MLNQHLEAKTVSVIVLQLLAEGYWFNRKWFAWQKKTSETHLLDKRICFYGTQRSKHLTPRPSLSQTDSNWKNGLKGKSTCFDWTTVRGQTFIFHQPSEGTSDSHKCIMEIVSHSFNLKKKKNSFCGYLHVLYSIWWNKTLDDFFFFF